MYEQKVTNIPALVLTPGGLGSSHNELKGAQTIRGVELEVLGEVLPGWNAAFSYGYTENDTEGDKRFPSIEIQTRHLPKNRASLYSTYEFLRGSLRGLRVGGAVIHKGDYSFVDISPDVVNRYGQFVGSGYTRVDLNISYSVQDGPLAGMELFSNVENVTDEDYFFSRNGTPAFTITHAPPRTVTLGARYRFGPRQ